MRCCDRGMHLSYATHAFVFIFSLLFSPPLPHSTFCSLGLLLFLFGLLAHSAWGETTATMPMSIRCCFTQSSGFPNVSLHLLVSSGGSVVFVYATTECVSVNVRQQTCVVAIGFLLFFQNTCGYFTFSFTHNVFSHSLINTVAHTQTETDTEPHERWRTVRDPNT